MQDRISKDLHDDIGSSLSSLQIYSSLASKLMDKEPLKAREMLQQIASNTESIIGNMEDIVWAMQPVSGQNFSLETRIKNFASSLLTLKNINCTCHFDNNIESLCRPVEMRKNILLITKEALNNISKYSGAGNAFISLTRLNGDVVLEVKDDGKGFDAEGSKNGNGLRNMKTRARLLGGHTVISSGAGSGTIVVTTIPLTNISDTEPSLFKRNLPDDTGSGI